MTPRYVLHCYVCQGGRVQWTGDMGTVDFPSVFIRRPLECKYAILEQNGKFILADLWEVLMPTDGWVQLGDHRVFKTIESALAAAQMTY